MDMKGLKQINQIQQMTQDTVKSLTEPIQPMYLMLKPEQYNLLAQHISLIGSNHCAEHGFDIRIADTGGIGQFDRRIDPTEFDQDAANRRGEDGLDQIFRGGQVIKANGEFDESTAYGHLPDDKRTGGMRLDAVEAETEMGGSWGDIAVNSLYLAADLAMIGGTDNEKSKPKYVRERKHGQKKKKQDEQSQDTGYELKM